MSKENYERTDVNVRWIYIAGVIVFVGSLVTALLCIPLTKSMLQFADDSRDETLYHVKRTVERPPLVLEVHPREERLELTHPQEKTLVSYGWMNEDKTLARIPIEEAKKRAIEENIFA